MTQAVAQTMAAIVIEELNQNRSLLMSGPLPPRIGDAIKIKVLIT